MLKKITNIIFECLHLKRIKHEGWRFCGVDNPDSVAEHCLNAAQIGYLLAKMEWVDAGKVVNAVIWHDIAETRIGDLHRMAGEYLAGKKEAENKVILDQFGSMPFYEEISSLHEEYRAKSSLEGRIAYDADVLEQAFQAKAYLENGHILAERYLVNFEGLLQTESAKAIYKTMRETDSYDWVVNRHKNNMK